MFVYVNTFENSGISLDVIEDALEDAVKGFGEVTGSGTGIRGSNWDVEISDNTLDVRTVLQTVREALRPFNLPSSTRIVIGNEYPLNPLDSK
jgi:hypothetical protein